MPGLLALATTTLSLVWTLAIVAAPVVLASEHPRFAVPAAVTYLGASRICHQRPERTFHVAGLPMPVCARCSGLYVSGTLGAVAAWLWRRRGPMPSLRAWLILAAMPTAVTWTLEFAGVAAFSNVARALAALPLGTLAGWLFVRALRDDAARMAAPR